jgi:pseudoazurin
MRRRTVLALATGLAATSFLPVPVRAARHTVRMLNFAPDMQSVMVFEPSLVRARVGDSVHFELVDPLHNAQMAEGMWPEGAPKFEGRLDESVTLTLTKEGVYGIICAPHYAAGMVALIVAGRPVNLASAKAARHPELAQARFDALFAQLGQARLNAPPASVTSLPADQAWLAASLCTTRL